MEKGFLVSREPYASQGRMSSRIPAPLTQPTFVTNNAFRYIVIHLLA